MLLSGVVRNRKMATVADTAREIALSFDGSEIGDGALTTWGRIWMYLTGSALLRNFKLRVHKFIFQWDLVVHLAICIFSLAPFMLTGSRLYSVVPIIVWAFYNILFLIGTRRASLVIPNFGRLKHSFKALVEEFFSPKLLPVLSVSFLLVALSLSVTGRRLGGPPLCYSTCKKCLALWENAIPISMGSAASLPVEPDRASCGYSNGRELMGYYTMAQTSFLLFLSVIIAMAVCMAWKVADDELAEREAAEEWLKREDPQAFLLRDELIKKFGPPASPIRPEGSPVWVAFGIVAALTFTLLGWHNWYVLPPSPTATMLIMLNSLTILMSSLILHMGFFGRLLALYKRNFLRVAYLTMRLEEMGEGQVDTWWNCRSFVLNDDLALDYDIGGLAVSAAFVVNLIVFLTLMGSTWADGFGAMMEPPGSYCAYACMYITACLIKIFTLATNTFEEQHRHVTGLQTLSILLQRGLLSNKSSSSLDCTWSTDPNDSVGGGGAGGNMQGGGMHSLQLLHSMGLLPREAGGEGISPRASSQDEVAMTMDEVLPSAVGGGVGGSGGGVGSSNGGGVSGDDLVGNGGLGVGERCNDSGGPADLEAEAEAAAAATAAALERELERDGSRSRTSRGVDWSMFQALGFGGAASSKPSTQASVPTSSSRDGWDRDRDDLVVVGKVPLAGLGISALTSATLASHSASQASASAGVNALQVGGKYQQQGMNRTTSVGGNLESRRQTLAEMVSQIRKYDPYPCILGIPVMPALFATSKFYIFICFVLIGSRIMVSCMRQLW